MGYTYTHRFGILVILVGEVCVWDGYFLALTSVFEFLALASSSIIFFCICFSSDFLRLAVCGVCVCVCVCVCVRERERECVCARAKESV